MFCKAQCYRDNIGFLPWRNKTFCSLFSSSFRTEKRFIYHLVTQGFSTCIAKDLDKTGNTPFSVGRYFAFHKIKSTPYEDFSLTSPLLIHEVCLTESSPPHTIVKKRKCWLNPWSNIYIMFPCLSVIFMFGLPFAVQNSLIFMKSNQLSFFFMIPQFHVLLRDRLPHNKNLISHPILHSCRYLFLAMEHYQMYAAHAALALNGSPMHEFQLP